MKTGDFKNRDLAIVVLCAGKGTRMKSERAKVLHEAAGKPLFAWTLDLSLSLASKQVIAVVGHEKNQVCQAISGRYGDRVQTVDQEQQLGTGHALQMAFKQIDQSIQNVMVLYGDTPLLTYKTLEDLKELQTSSHSEIAIISALAENPHGYGRVIRGEHGEIRKIVEEKDASDTEKTIKEINSGIYMFSYGFLEQNLFKLSDQNEKREYYLTDLIAMATRPVVLLKAQETEIKGVNDQIQLAQASKILRNRINHKWMLSGVLMEDPDSVVIDDSVELSPDVYLEPGVILKGCTRIEPFAHIAAYSVLEGAHVGRRTHVGPFARLRPGAKLLENSKVGNFVELKQSTLGSNSKVNHLAYIGDTTIGSRANIGAGTITCNYDGVKKHPTQIGDGVFVGSNSTLVAPVELKADSYIAAGSVINQIVPEKSLGIGRARQVNKEGWKAKNERTVPGDSSV